MLQKSTLKFLKELKENNVKEWFDAHRRAYDAARADFINLVSTVIEQYGKEDEDISTLQAKDCLFRINRDVRFSKNKAPYKTNFGASIARGGKMSIYAGYYIHIEPGNESFVGGGLWMPEAEQLKKVRQEIDYNWEEFQSILKQKKFKATFKDLYKGKDISLSVMPKGYPKDHEAIEYLKLKSFIAETHFQDEELTKASLHKKTVAAFEALQPLVNFINKALED